MPAAGRRAPRGPDAQRLNAKCLIRHRLAKAIVELVQYDAYERGPRMQDVASQSRTDYLDSLKLKYPCPYCGARGLRVTDRHGKPLPAGPYLPPLGECVNRHTFHDSRAE